MLHISKKWTQRPIRNIFVCLPMLNQQSESLPGENSFKYLPNNNFNMRKYVAISSISQSTKLYLKKAY